MRKALGFLIIVAVVLAFLLVRLPSPVTPAAASPAPVPTLANTTTAVASFVTAQPATAPAVVIVAPVATVPPTAAQGVQPTTEPPHVVVVVIVPKAEPPATVAQQSSATVESARLMRAELRLWTEFGLRVNINAYGVYTVRDASGAQVDPTPLERMTISWVTANER